MEAKLHNKSPKYLNLFKIRQPLPAIVSILHRISGILLFFPGIPLLLYSLQMLLQSQQSYEALKNYWHYPITKLTLFFLLWLFVHHLCAGIRHVLLDLHVGITLSQARNGSKLVLAAGIIITALAGLILW